MKVFGWILSIVATILLLGGVLISVFYLVYSGPSTEGWVLGDRMLMQVCCPLPILLAGGIILFFATRLIRSGGKREQEALARFPAERSLIVRVPERRNQRYKMPDFCVACGNPAVQKVHKVGLFSDKRKSGVQTYTTTYSISFPLCARCQEPKTRVEKKRIKNAVNVRPSKEYPGYRDIIFSNAEFAHRFDELNQDRLKFSINRYIG